MKFAKKYFLYLIRWQLSTPILAVVLLVLSDLNAWAATIIANLIGGLIFFWIDMLIFKKKSDVPLWEIKNNVKCADCNKECKGYRIVMWGNYDKSTDKNPKYRCKKCSLKKKNEVEKTI